MWLSPFNNVEREAQSLYVIPFYILFL